MASRKRFIFLGVRCMMPTACWSFSKSYIQNRITVVSSIIFSPAQPGSSSRFSQKLKSWNTIGISKAIPAYLRRKNPSTTIFLRTQKLLRKPPRLSPLTLAPACRNSTPLQPGPLRTERKPPLFPFIHSYIYGTA